MEEEALFVFPTDDSIQYLGKLKSDASQKDLKFTMKIHRSGKQSFKRTWQFLFRVRITLHDFYSNI